MRLGDLLRPARARADLPATLAAASLTADQRRFFDEQGYVILPKLLSPTRVDRLRAHLNWLWANRAAQGQLPIDIYFDTPREARIFFRKAKDEARDAPYKIVDLHLQDALVRDACTTPALTGALTTLLGARPIVCNSLLFEWGSQQYPHFDTFFMPSPTKDLMAASWIALDEVTETNGPLYFYPRSHRIDPFVFSHGRTTAVFSELKTGAAAHIERIVAEHGLERRLFLAEPGDVLIWHAQLLHGGSAIIAPGQRRRSLVTHYWTEHDYPDPGSRIDFGDGRWLLKRDHQFVVDDEILAEVDAFLASMTVPAEMKAKAPAAFDPRLYLARNQDVLHAGLDPWTHYVTHGHAEGRVW